MNRLTLLLLIFIMGSYSFASSEHSHKQSTENFILSSAGNTLSLAQMTEQRAVEVLKNANKLRTTINELRAKERNSTVESEIEFLKTQVNLLVEQLQLWQNQGAHLRQTSAQLKLSASELLPIGFQAYWPNEVTHTGALTLVGNENAHMAHNAMVRSVHPTMLGNMTDGAETETADDMTLAMPAMTGQSAPEQLNISTFQVSRDLQFFAHIEPISQNDSAQGSLPLNSIHQWRLFIVDSQGMPVSNAQIEFSGHMPGHVHGLPTQPRVVEETSSGIYLVDGVKFQMKGWWVIEFTVQSGGKTDSLVFNLSL